MTSVVFSVRSVTGGLGDSVSTVTSMLVLRSGIRSEVVVAEIDDPVLLALSVTGVVWSTISVAMAVVGGKSVSDVVVTVT